MKSRSKTKGVSFKAVVRKERVNPYVDAPLEAGRKLSADYRVIPVTAYLDGHPFTANLMPLGKKRTQAAPGTHHRLYLNGIMRKAIGKDLGDTVRVRLVLDRKPRVESVPFQMAPALKKDSKAHRFFNALSPSRRKELLRYLNQLKTPETFEKTLRKVLRYLKNPQSVGAASHVIVRSVSRWKPPKNRS